MTTSQGGYVNGGFDLLKAPDAPTITSVTKNIGSVSVAFTAPANPGGSAVTGYTVTAINESTGASVGATGSGSPISVSTGGGTFRVRAAATNIYGPGRVSAFNTGNVVPYSGAELYTWGSNNTWGWLGLGDTNSRSTPTRVGALTNWSQVSAGGQFTSAVRGDGTLFTWGYNNVGQLGQNNLINRSSPVQVGALTNWAQVSAGSNSSAAAIKTDGTLWTWGFNGQGQIGDGTTTNRSSPIQVGSLTNWAQVSAGIGFCASIKTDGTLWAWGQNEYGKLGDNTRVDKSSPVQIGTLTNWSQVSAGQRATVAVRFDYTLWTWGTNAGRGALGNGLFGGYRSSPVQVGALTNWSKVSAASDWAASIKTDGTLWTWGDNSGGQLGDNTRANRSSPIQVGSLTNWSQVDTDTTEACAVVKTDGTLWAWGTTGYLGNGSVQIRSSPIQVGSLTNWAQVSAGFRMLAALQGVT